MRHADRRRFKTETGSRPKRAFVDLALASLFVPVLRLVSASFFSEI